MNPFLYGLVSLIWLITQLSGAPNPARSPVSGWIHPIVIDLPLDALAVLPARGGALDARAAGLEQAAAPDDGRADAGRAEQAAPGNTATVRLARTGLISLVGHDLNISFRRDAEIVAEDTENLWSEC